MLGGWDRSTLCWLLRFSCVNGPPTSGPENFPAMLGAEQGGRAGLFPAGLASTTGAWLLKLNTAPDAPLLAPGLGLRKALVGDGAAGADRSSCGYPLRPVRAALTIRAVEDVQEANARGVLLPLRAREHWGARAAHRAETDTRTKLGHQSSPRFACSRVRCQH